VIKGTNSSYQVYSQKINLKNWWTEGTNSRKPMGFWSGDPSASN